MKDDRRERQDRLVGEGDREGGECDKQGMISYG